MTKHSRLLGRDNRGSFPRPDSALLQPQFRGRGRVSAGAARPGSLPRGREARGQRKSGRLRGPGGRASGGTRVGTSQSGRWPDLAPAHLVCVVSQPANEVLDPAAVFVLAGRAAAPTAAAGSRAPGRGRAQPPAYPDGAGPARQRRSGRRRRVQPVLAECRRRQQLEEEEKKAEAVGPAREAVRCSPGPLHRRRMPTPRTPAAGRSRPPPQAPRHTPEPEPGAPWIRGAGPLRPHRLAACPSSPAHCSLARVASGFGGPGFGCQDAGLIGWNVAETVEVIPRSPRVSKARLPELRGASFLHKNVPRSVASRPPTTLSGTLKLGLGWSPLLPQRHP